MKNVLRIASWCIVAALLAISISVGFNRATALRGDLPRGVEVVKALTYDAPRQQ